MHSFYYLVNIDRNEMQGDYKSILIAFDDETGHGIHYKTIEGHELDQFKNGQSIHYEEMFLTDKSPTKFVAWATDMNGEWTDRIERLIG